MNKVLRLEGLDCAACAAELEELINRIEGVEGASVDFIAQKVRFSCEGEEAAAEVIKCCNGFEDVKVVEHFSPGASVNAHGGSGECSGHNGEGHSRGEGCACGHRHEHNREHTHGEEHVHGECCGHNHNDGCCLHGHSEGGAEEGGAKEGPAGVKLKIKNLCCANCGRELEEILNKIDGVDAAVDFMNMSVTLSCADSAAYDKAVYEITHFEDVEIDDGKPKKKSLFKQHLKEIVLIIVSVVFFIPALVLNLAGGDVGVIISYPLFAVSYLSVGWEVLVNTAKNISKGRIFDENFLMTIASVAAIVLGVVSGDGIYEGVAVMLLYQVGELLQSIAVGSSRNSITKLMDLKSESATLLKDGSQIVVKPEDLLEGDIILIKAGEKVPVDGVIVRGETSLDMRSLNGESLPLEAREGQEILSGAINLSKVIEVRVLRRYADSAVAKILDLVENSTAKKAKPEKFITKFAKYYTPAVCAAALIVAALVPTIVCAVSGAFAWATYSDWISKALSFLVISCPCALVISVPLSYFGGIGQCARFGILAKGSTAIDELALCTVAAFDKTGTITEGSFAVNSYTGERALMLAAAAEKYSSHPIAAAFANISSPYAVSDAEEISGRGIKCLSGGKTVLCGNAALMEENGVAYEKKESIYTLIYVASDGEYVGCVEIGDAVKSGAKQAIADLKAQDVAYCTMLTGDNPARAAAVAAEVGLDGFEAGLLPGDKLAAAEKLKERGKLLYAGDGINDAPVMAAADCAVSMGKVGSDAAIEASDLVLVTDNLELLPKGKKIAKGTRRIVFQNIAGSLLVKLAVMVLGIVIDLPLIIAVVADVGVMLVAVLNAMRTRLIK